MNRLWHASQDVISGVRRVQGPIAVRLVAYQSREPKLGVDLQGAFEKFDRLIAREDITAVGQI